MPPTNDPSHDASLATGKEHTTASGSGDFVAPTQMTYRGTLIKVTAEQNSRGAWLPRISATHDGRELTLTDVETVTPEWLTEAEALRAGVEQGRYLVDRNLSGTDTAEKQVTKALPKQAS